MDRREALRAARALTLGAVADCDTSKVPPGPGGFLAGRRRRTEDVAKRVLADGHDLGNHTQHHADIKRMTPAQAHAEIAECAHSLTGLRGRGLAPMTMTELMA
jgi:hypothetical protein